MSRVAGAAAILVGLFSAFGAREARAQDRIFPLQESKLLFMPSDSSVPMASSVAAEEPQVSLATPPVFRSSTTKKMLPFYASTAVMQALDVHSTLQVLGHGGGEGNPMLQGIVSNRPVFVAVKAAVAASTIYAASRIAKRSKVGAVVTLVAINSVYAMVASHNYKLAREMR